MRASDEPPRRSGGPTDAELLAMPDAAFADAMADVASLLSEGPVDIAPAAPSSGLWDAIASAVEAETDRDRFDSTAGRPEIAVIRGEGHDDPRSSGGFSDPDRRLVNPPGRPKDSSPAMTRARDRWGGRTAVLTLVAAVVLLVLVPIGLSLGSDGDEPVVLARAELEVLTSDATRGLAELLEDESKVLRVDVEATAPDGEYLELWLLSVGDDGLLADPVSLGRVGGSDTFIIPPGVDTDVFDVVDISIEADDGDASHSGNSVLRGPLTT